MLSIIYDERHYAEHHYAERYYAECCYVECRDTLRSAFQQDVHHLLIDAFD